MLRFLSRLQPWSLMLVRVVLGVSMLVHGWEKLIPAGGLERAHPLAGIQAFNHFVATLGLPYWMGYISVATEFLGGLLLVVGSLTRLVALLVAINMAVAITRVNFHHGYGGSEYSLALLAMALLLVTAGSGALSLDRRLGIG